MSTLSASCCSLFPLPHLKAHCLAGAWGYYAHDLYDEAEVLLISPSTGNYSLVILPPQDVEEEEYASLCGWSRCGLLLIRPLAQNGSTVLSCYTRQGVCAHTVPVPLNALGQPAYEACWVPREEGLVLVHNTYSNRAGPDLWLWHVADSRVQHLDTAPHTVLRFTFSPCGSQLLGCCGLGICLVDLATLAITHQVPGGLHCTAEVLCGDSWASL